MKYITAKSVELIKESVCIADANLDTETLQRAYIASNSVLIFGDKHSKMELHRSAFKFYNIGPKDKFEEFEPSNMSYVETKMNKSGGFSFSSNTQQYYNVVIYESEFYIVSDGGTRINKVRPDAKFVEKGFVFKIDKLTGSLRVKNVFNALSWHATVFASGRECIIPGVIFLRDDVFVVDNM